MCCNMLQTHVRFEDSEAVCCSVLQCVAVCCSVLQCVAICYRLTFDSRTVLQCVAACCSVLQCVAVCCNVLQYVADSRLIRGQ